MLVRHGQSEWNLKNLFTGWRDPDLTELGVEEAHAAGRRLKAKGVSIDCVFTSELVRAERTSAIIMDELGQSDLPVTRAIELNERDYGDLSGLNKDEARERWGEEQVRIWRRSYDIAPPGGESLRDTLARTLPYYVREILPEVLGGKTVMVTAHGNSLRGLVMVLEGLDKDKIVEREINTGVPLVYRIDAQARVIDLETIASD